VVWDDEEQAYVTSLDITDRVMGHQSFQGASTPVSSNVKEWKEKGKESKSTWQ